MVTVLVSFRKDIVHITVSLLLSKAWTKLDIGADSGALLNDLSLGLKYISVNAFTVKPHAHSLDSHVQRICNVYSSQKCI